MRVLLLCSSDYMAIPAALVLQQQNALAAVVVPDKYALHLQSAFVQGGVSATLMHQVGKSKLSEELTALIGRCEADVVFVITFPWKLSIEVLGQPPKGCVNFHPGILPQYRGADPIFWQLRNREAEIGLSVHRMTEAVDEGPLLLTRTIPAMPGETYGTLHKRLGLLTADCILQTLQQIENEVSGQAQPMHESRYFKKPIKNQVTINWQTQGAEEIEALVNAGNPKYNGAFTHLRGMEMTLLEVSVADVTNPPADIAPGTVIYADALYGLIAACKGGKFLRINIICIPEGYFSGPKLFNLGFGPGDRFMSDPQ